MDAFYEKALPYLEGKIPTDNPQLIKKILRDPDFEGRFKKLSELPEELSIFFEDVPDYPPELIMREKFNITPEMLKQVIESAKKVISEMDWKKGDSKKADELTEKMTGIVSELNLKTGQVLWPIRVALSGLEKSPNFSTLMVYLGKKETLKRLDFALQKAK